jgi:hypothetical protein
MRTTITLEADVEQLLRDETYRSRKSFKTVVNEAIRKGLQANSVNHSSAPYVVHPSKLGLREGIDPFNLHALSDEIEAEQFLSKNEALSYQKKEK